MASFVESATLALNDDTSAKVNRINKSLDGLFKRMKKLETLAGKEIELKFKATSINRAVAQIDRAHAKLKAFGQTTIEPKIRINTSDVVDKLAAIKRTANFATRTTMRVDTADAMRQIQAVRQRANTAVTTRLQLQTQAAPAAEAFSNSVLARASSWGRAFSRVVGHELGMILRQTAVQAGRKAGEGIMSLSDANLALEMAVGNRPGSDNLMKTIRDTALQLSTGEFKGVSQAGLIELGAEAVSNLGSLDPASIRGMMELSAKNAAMLGALEKNTDAGNEQARILNKINAQLNVASDPEKAARYDAAIIAQRAASGSDFTMQQIQNMLQQVPPALRKVMTPEAVARLGNIREEGGRQSTADVRMAFNDLMRRNLNKVDKANMVRFGLRNKDGTANAQIVNEAGTDPVQFALDRILPKLKAAGVDIDDYGAMQTFLGEVGGFTNSGAKFWADIIGSRDQIAIGDRGRRGARPEAALERDASLRQSFNRFDQQFQNVAARATESVIPLANEALQTVTDTLAKQAEGKQLTAVDWAAIAGGTVTAGIGASLVGMMDPATRPLATAGLALTASAGALTAAAGALGLAAGVKGIGSNLPGGINKLGKAVGIASGALAVGNLIGNAESIDPKTGEKVGMKNAILDVIADIVVAGKDREAWKTADAVKKINEQPLNVLPPMNRAEMRDAGMFSQNSEDIKAALAGGAENVKAAGDKVSVDLATGAANGAMALGNGIVTGAQTAAGILAAAITSAASNIRIAANAQAVAATPTLDTGANTFGPR
jgi:hypothetical protein